MADNLTTQGVTRVIKDDKGVPHKYFSVPHRYSEAAPLGGELLEMFGPMLAFQKGADGIVGGFGEVLVRKGDTGIVERLLKHTTRDGLKLDEPAALDLAYTGNLGEVIRAIDFVIEVHFAGFFDGLGELLVNRLVQPLLSKSSALLPLLEWIGASGGSSAPATERWETSEEDGASRTSSTPTSTSKPSDASIDLRPSKPDPPRKSHPDP